MDDDSGFDFTTSQSGGDVHSPKPGSRPQGPRSPHSKQVGKRLQPLPQLTKTLNKASDRWEQDEAKKREREVQARDDRYRRWQLRQERARQREERKRVYTYTGDDEDEEDDGGRMLPAAIIQQAAAPPQNPPPQPPQNNDDDNAENTGPRNNENIPENIFPDLPYNVPLNNENKRPRGRPPKTKKNASLPSSPTESRRQLRSQSIEPENTAQKGGEFQGARRKQPMKHAAQAEGGGDPGMSRQAESKPKRGKEKVSVWEQLKQLTPEGRSERRFQKHKELTDSVRELLDQREKELKLKATADRNKRAEERGKRQQ